MNPTSSHSVYRGDPVKYLWKDVLMEIRVLRYFLTGAKE